MSKKILIIVFSLIFTTIVSETVLRFIVKHSTKSYGVLFNRELPPMKLLPTDAMLNEHEKEKYLDKKYGNLIVDGKHITNSDMFGIDRDDEVLGYTLRENSKSTNGWWQSNNIGARSSKNSSYDKSADRNRVLFFGDSYTHGIALPGDETFVSYIDDKNKSIEAINLGVDGYSTGQAFLRFRTLKDKLEFDHVILVFVPSAALQRDINVSRYVGFGWDGFGLQIMPRFVLENGELKHIRSPYKTLDELIDDNSDSIKYRLRDHLRKYDSFYFKFWHESNSVFDNIISYKLYKRRLYYTAKSKVIGDLMNVNGEALKLTQAIIDSMDRETKLAGGRFSLIILPTSRDIEKYSDNPDYRKAWNDMSSFICEGRIDCHDLMEDFTEGPIEFLDTAYDGTHYGPKANNFIAEVISNRIIDEFFPNNGNL